MALVTLAKLALASSLLAIPFAPHERDEEIPRTSEGKIDFARLAEGFRRIHGVGDGAPLPPDIDTLLGTQFVPAKVGAIDLWYPRWELSDRARWEEFRTLTASALQLQGQWLDWLGSSGDGALLARKDLVELEKWVKAAKLPSPSARDEGGLFEMLGAKEPQTAMIEELARLMRTPEGLGIMPMRSKAPRVLLAPSRFDLLALGAFFGEADVQNRSIYWNDDLPGWTEFAWIDLQVVALEYPPASTKGDEVTHGTAMNGREPTGLIQHVVQRMAMGLEWFAFDQRVDTAIELGIAQALVIELCGQNNVRSGGSGRAGSSAGTEAFVPGGNASGGSLPQTNADSRWRSTVGVDFFVKPLREAQKAGAKACSKEKGDKNVWFQLVSDAGGERVCVRPPFFGAAAKDKERPAPQFLSDYLEFFRGYKTAFVHWWRTEAGGKGPEGEKKFGELLRRTAGHSDEPVAFEALVKELYGLPLSSADGESLESAFLDWLAKR